METTPTEAVEEETTAAEGEATKTDG